MLSRVGAKRRISWLVAASALAPLFLGVSQPALAQCSGPTTGVTCTTTGNNYSSPIAGNPYQSNAGGGINDNTNNGLGGTPVILTLDPGVNVTIPTGSGGVNAVNAANTTGPTAASAPITIIANGTCANL